MAIAAAPALSAFAHDVAEGLSAPVKNLSPRYLYDDLGSALFEAITALPEYGLTRADERLIERHSGQVSLAATFDTVCELGSGSGRKTRHVLEAIGKQVEYRPIDVSAAALALCEKELGSLAQVKPMHGDWMEGLRSIAADRLAGPMLLLFLGSSIGNLDRGLVVPFLHCIRKTLRPGDCFLIGFDLVKDIDRMIEAYDDATGVTAAFNLNLLARMNRELDAEFDLRSFHHEARWNEQERRIEMHLVSLRKQRVHIGALDRSFGFEAGETIWTESSHKFTRDELTHISRSSGFEESAVWIDEQWPFAEALWQVS